jgi:putative intracellular protease/amidase
MPKVLIAIPQERFRDEELLVTREELERSEYTVVIASIRRGRRRGSRGGPGPRFST